MSVSWVPLLLYTLGLLKFGVEGFMGKLMCLLLSSLYIHNSKGLTYLSRTRPLFRLFFLFLTAVTPASIASTGYASFTEQNSYSASPQHTSYDGVDQQDRSSITAALSRTCNKFFSIMHIPFPRGDLQHILYMTPYSAVNDINIETRETFKVYNYLNKKVNITNSGIEALGIRPGDILILPAKQLIVVRAEGSIGGSVVGMPQGIDFIFIDGVYGGDDEIISKPMLLSYVGYTNKEGGLKKHEFALLSDDSNAIQTYIKVVLNFPYACWSELALEARQKLQFAQKSAELDSAA